MRLKFRLLCIGIFLSSFLQYALAQTISVSGNVKNKNTSEVLIRATVSVKGTSTTTVTDENGNFSIATQKGATLIISYTGFAGATYQVKDAGPIEILLEDAGKKMDEVVVIGYGSQKTKNISKFSQNFNNALCCNNPVKIIFTYFTTFDELCA